MIRMGRTVPTATGRRASATVGGVVRPDPEITCVDCGGRCRPLGLDPDDEVEPGTVVPYRCADCNDRWDVVMGDPDGVGDDDGW